MAEIKTFRGTDEFVALARLALGERPQDVPLYLGKVARRYRASAPDLAEEDIGPVTEALMRHAVDGIAVSNTTLARPANFADRAAAEAGGLSGRPLFHRATVMLARVHQATDGKIPLIGIGGIDSGETALAKIEAGASLLQLYTGLIYEGPSLIARITAHLARACQERRVSSITELTGTRAADWAGKSLD